jgi:hypothetical protein
MIISHDLKLYAGFDHSRLPASEVHSRVCIRLVAMTSKNHLDPYGHSQPSRTRKLKEVVRRSLLKQYAITPISEQRHLPIDQYQTPRRPKMGMKDSDDYITARAANPRTGLISPSLAGTPRTSESPAEALKLRSQRIRPALTCANEARKISAGGLQKLCSSDQGWSFEDAKARVASPRPSDASADAADIISCEPISRGSTAEDDRSVVHMPSAREPQPYAFPGRSAQEIQAFEHYKRKARKTSGDGWDQRCVQSGGIRKSSATEHERGRKRITSYGMPGQIPTRDGMIVNRGMPSIEGLDGTTLAGADPRSLAMAFAPYSSPKTPARRTSGGHNPKSTRKLHDYAATISSKQHSSPPITHLSQLPKLHLVHPELASLPLPKLRRTADKGQRSCSLGCDRSPDADICPQLVSSHRHVQPLFDEAPASLPVEHVKALATYIFGMLRTLHDSLGATVRITVPRPAMVHTLTDPDASLEEKVAASRALLALVGQVVGVFLAITVVWKLVDAVAGVISLVIWPLVVPMRVIWWFMSG